MVSARSEKELSSLVKQCENSYGNKHVFYKVCDATNDSENAALVEFTIEKFGKIDILVLAAGVAAHAAFRNL